VFFRTGGELSEFGEVRVIDLALLAGTASGSAKTIVDGYLITSKNDTVKCRINVNDLELFDKVTIVDTTDKDVTYRSKRKEINGFGFTYKDETFDYVLKADPNSNWHFFMREAQGKRLNLYYRYYWMSYYRGGSVKSEYYLLETPDQQLLLVENGLLSGYKRKIKDFLNGDAALTPLFEKTVNKFEDIPQFVKAANDQ
jgi:hypothetical protein